MTRTYGLAVHPWFALAFSAVLGLAAGACGDDDDAVPGDTNDDGDDQGTEPDAAGQAADAAPEPTIDAAPSGPDAAVETTVRSIGMGNSVSCAVLSTGTVRCWGANEQGQSGIGTLDSPQTSPTDVVGLTSAVSVDCGTAHCCAGTEEGGAQCWGWNAAGELGANLTGAEMFNRPTPGSVLEPAAKGVAEVSGATQVAAGGAHNCAVKGGEVWCWGWNAAGQGGNDPQGGANGNLYVANPSGITDVVQVALAHAFLAEHSCAVTSSGQAICWGLNDQGQLGDGGTAGRHTAAPVGLVSVTAVAAGSKHTCAIGRPADAPKSEPAVFCWGLNDFGQAGPDAVSPQLTPIAVPGVEGAVALAGGQSHTCALLDTGSIRCWGANNFGQLGDGTVVNHAEPSDVVSPDGSGMLIGVAQVATGFGNSCARTVTGRVFCWGLNDLGQLGQGTATPEGSLAPIEVPVLPER
ncbi:MAG TPA: hypothetical protein VK698_04300 [Kofleriaceae bacterium]|nr:hypothetical protein [Kofleriaceae bacterium]